MGADSSTPKPPEPPATERRIHLPWYEWVGVGFLLLLPVLGLFGVFGLSTATTESSSSQLHLQIEYPDRLRYLRYGHMIIEVTNLSSTTLPTVTVQIDRHYLDRFTGVSVTPQVEQITGQEVEVVLHELAAGSRRIVQVEFRGEDYWRHEGLVSASTSSGQIVESKIDTWVFP
jgi:hypothetical protein